MSEHVRMLSLISEVFEHEEKNLQTKITLKEMRYVQLENACVAVWWDGPLTHCVCRSFNRWCMTNTSDTSKYHLSVLYSVYTFLSLVQLKTKPVKNMNMLSEWWIDECLLKC